MRQYPRNTWNVHLPMLRSTTYRAREAPRGPGISSALLNSQPSHVLTSSFSYSLALQGPKAAPFAAPMRPLAPVDRHKLYLSCLVSFRDIVHVRRFKGLVSPEKKRAPLCRCAGRARLHNRARSPPSMLTPSRHLTRSMSPVMSSFHTHTQYAPLSPDRFPLLTVAAPCTQCRAGTGACLRPWPSGPPCG